VGQKSDTSRTLHYIVREVSLFWPTLYVHFACRDVLHKDLPAIQTILWNNLALNTLSGLLSAGREHSVDGRVELSEWHSQVCRGPESRLPKQGLVPKPQQVFLVGVVPWSLDAEAFSIAKH